MPDLLIELFSEEIPARMQSRAAEDLKKRMTDGLVEAGLTYAGAAAFSTPRRLVLTVSDLLAESPTLREERKGPRVDAPDKAIDGFLRGAGLTRDQLEERETPKGNVFFATIEKPGRPAAQIVAEVLDDVIRNFPWPKSMRWGAGSLRWVRPLQSILCILVDEEGARVVPLEVDGIAAGDTTEGHRFMAPGRFPVTSYDDYTSKLAKAFVQLNATDRADHIWADATNMAFAAGLEVVEDKGLLAEVAGLVEWPVVLMGDIADDFLDLPAEVLQTSMREHQKFFSVRNAKTGRIEKFITVANRDTADQGATILAGNQKVLSARLADAKFFWENDLRIAKSGMEAWEQALENVTFERRLGTQAERIKRIATLSRSITARLLPEEDLDAIENAGIAAHLAKADLSSEMVYEFPELQGVMGRYYALQAGHPAEVAAVAQEHYQPLGPSDAVPTARLSVAVALADKIDLLAAFWAIDEKPTGSKDPFALRRAALGIVRILLENELWLPLSELIEKALMHREGSGAIDLRKGGSSDDLWDTVTGISGNLMSFIHDRLKVYLRDQGIRHDIIDACLAMPGNDNLTLLVKRARALSEALATEDGENLIQGFKRANNILTQAEEADGVSYSFGPDPKFAETDSETALFAALDQAQAVITPAMEDEDFATAMHAMAGLRGPIDAFFEDVKVNSDNSTVRRNRLNLLHRIRTICGGVADLTRIEG